MAAWWPEGAPYPRRRFADYTTHELAALTEFAAALDDPRGVQLHAALARERAERRELERAERIRLAAGARF